MNTLCRTSSLVRLKLNAHSGRRRRTQRKDICSSVWQTTCGREFSFLRPQGTKHQKNIGAGNNRSWKSFENLNFTWAASQIEAQGSSSVEARPQSKQQWDRPCLWARDGLWPMLLFSHFIRKFVHLGFPGYKMFPFIMILLGPQQCGNASK